MTKLKDEDDFQTDHLEKLAEEDIDLTEPEASDDIESLKEEKNSLQDRLLRSFADLENTRKRGERDRREAEEYGGSRLAKDMLAVYDNLRRAVDAVTEEQRESSKAVIEGVELTLKELIHVFGKHGIEPILPEIGDKFDPQEHQAMFEAPSPDVKAGYIIQVLAEGFILKERLLRPAQVGVSSTP
jgi:molecular chaperone GrpE